MTYSIAALSVCKDQGGELGTCPFATVSRKLELHLV